jgi:hypothetical protein
MFGNWYRSKVLEEETPSTFLQYYEWNGFIVPLHTFTLTGRELK